MDLSVSAVFKQLVSSFPAAEVSVLSRSHDNSTWVVQYTYDTAPQVRVATVALGGMLLLGCWAPGAFARCGNRVRRMTHQMAHGLPLQAFYVYRRGQAAPTFLFESRPDLKQYKLGRVHPGARVAQPYAGGCERGCQQRQLVTPCCLGIRTAAGW